MTDPTPPAPKEPDYADLEAPEWLSYWAEDVLYRAYDVERFGDTWHQRIVGYVRYLEQMAYEPAVALGEALQARDALESQSGAWQAEVMELRQRGTEARAELALLRVSGKEIRAKLAAAEAVIEAAEREGHGPTGHHYRRLTRDMCALCDALAAYRAKETEND